MMAPNPGWKVGKLEGSKVGNFRTFELSNLRTFQPNRACSSVVPITERRKQMAPRKHVSLRQWYPAIWLALLLIAVLAAKVSFASPAPGQRVLNPPPQQAAIPGQSLNPFDVSASAPMTTPTLPPFTPTNTPTPNLTPGTSTRTNTP